jgi:hypothetical protein
MNIGNAEHHGPQPTEKLWLKRWEIMLPGLLVWQKICKNGGGRTKAWRLENPAPRNRATNLKAWAVILKIYQHKSDVYPRLTPEPPYSLERPST